MKMRRFLLMAGLMAATVATAAMPADEYARLKAKTDVFLDSVQQHPDWLLSRLQMYWSTHATEVYLNSESFSHVGGERAPYPTVKFTGTRGTTTSYDRPAIADIVPYDDDEQGNVTFINRKERTMEKAHPSKTGTNIGALNRQILSIARDAARLYGENGDERYAGMAFGVFDTFLKGIYYRNVPKDLNHGHQETLTGMVSFEVIHEDIINELTETYKLLNAYKPLQQNRQIYDGALKKWAENIIANGVPHNNWDLIQAAFIMRIALVLQDDNSYADGKGRQYYLDYIVNKSSVRQWSMKRLADFGFDPQTYIWCESPGYSTMVVKEFVIFANMLDKEAGIDIFKQIPAITEAVFAQPQYLFPNRMICGFGDTHPAYLQTQTVELLRDYAQRHANQSLVERCDSLLAAISPDAPEALVNRYVSPTFHAPSVSWLVQRTGMNRERDLMISLNGSLGNHQHANGISMELYGKGYVLGPDAGIGRALYGGLDYSEYYSQFLAHNTVCVDGVSSYPVMMSQHAFDVQFLSSNSQGSVSQVYFLEPETQSDQLRTNGIVATPQGGYYIDIFRSRRQDGRDKFHDYFYHNMGQAMTLTAANGNSLNLQPTDELAFAGGHLYAYSYIYNKVSATTDSDVKAIYSISWPDGRRVDMNMWMRGEKDREVFQASSPVNLEYERLGSYYPYKVDEQPVLTFIARQHGSAWSHPFVAVYEPSASNAPSEIESVSFFTPTGQDAVGIKVVLKNGRTDYIFSAPKQTKMKYGKMSVNARYAVVSDGKTIVSE